MKTKTLPGPRIVLFSLAAFCLLLAGSPAKSKEKCLDIEEIQDAIEKEGAQWTAGHTSMSCNVNAHAKPLSLSQSIFNRHAAEHRGETFNPAAELPGGLLPDISPDEIRFSWHDHEGNDWMSPVKSQGDCGCCYAFGIVGALEGALNVKLRNPDLDLDLSEQFIVCEYGCEGAGVYNVLEYYLMDNGIPDEACFPYIAAQGSCDDACSDWMERTVSINEWDLIWQIDNRERIIKELILHSPVIHSVVIRSDFYAYSHGVYRPVTGEWVGPHIIVVVGWDDTNNSWICKNSWGTGWGMEGYFEFDRDEIGYDGWWVDVDETSIEAPMHANFTADPLEGPEPLSVQFTSLSSGTIDSFEWSFGDDSGDTSENPLHVYENPGTYTVSLTVTAGTESDTETKTGYILVTPAADEEMEEDESLEEEIDSEIEPEHPVEDIPESLDSAASDTEGDSSEEDCYSDNGCGCEIII